MRGHTRECEIVSPESTAPAMNSNHMHARNRDTVQGWINQWYPLASRAVHTFALLLEDTLKRPRTPLQHINEALDRNYRDCLRSMNLEVAG